MFRTARTAKRGGFLCATTAQPVAQWGWLRSTRAIAATKIVICWLYRIFDSTKYATSAGIYIEFPHVIYIYVAYMYV